MDSEKQSIGRRLIVLIFGDEAKSKEERWLVQKLDFFILTYCCFSFFFNYLDRSAFANAYVAGLQEALDLAGTDYNVLLSMTTAGYTIGQIPHSIAIQAIAPRIYFPTMVIIWAGLTMCSAACKTYGQLCAVRFLMGLIEASTYCGTLYVIGSWYKPREIAKRTAIFTASGQAGSMFAGVMMTAIYKGMNGYAHLAGWQWVFLIDGIITLPIAIMGYLYFPDIPENTKASFLSESEKRLALARLPPKREDGHNINPWSLMKRTFTSPTIYILCSFSVVCGALEAFCVQGCFLLWMKYQSKYFTQAQINTYPLGIQAVGIVSNLMAAVYIDNTGRRVPMGILACGLQLITSIILLVPNVSFAATFFAFYNAGTSYIINPLLFGWANIICQRGGDDALRAVNLAAMNAASQILYTFWGIVLYPASDVPYWRKGAIAMICIIVALLSMLWAMHWLDKHTAAKHPDVIDSSVSLSEIKDDITVKEKEKDLIKSGAAADAMGISLPA
ncbi:MFS general substrate transporter [Cryphonectria parasitica EP155]|uniref:MFS general substrate transporter n=1 Tax=Cryphonectria parasitica (strain ATCC 38755 / EP155) TaxID=660469 RepID=A0A9P4XZ99_CRYP1|nr:MFS general substrate transporter [Cryphonectria parasitica EP155]KAF3764079.1 MFS general substrate transporter [Cryphonectria parasitica EP155]